LEWAGHVVTLVDERMVKKVFWETQEEEETPEDQS
jgi:hypothetical protein